MEQITLENKIKALNEAYRNGNPQCSDSEYDELIDTLAKLYPDSDLLKVGVLESKPVTNKVELPYPMFSLNKVKTLKEIEFWLDKNNIADNDMIVVTPKFNGISVYVDFNGLKLFSRGDGVTGQDYSKHFIKTLKNVKNKVKVSFESEARAEAIISKENWEKFFKGKEINGKNYKLNHSAVAGIFNTIDISEQLEHIDFLPYELLGDYSSMKKIDQIRYINSVLENNKINFLFLRRGELKDQQKLDKFYKENQLLYPIDGLVLTINTHFNFGVEANGNPIHSRALKLEEWTSEHDVVIEGYSSQMSKQGKLRGVVNFKPVDIDGSEVKAATFNNAKFVFEMNIGLGTKITIKKSGEIIPKIVAVEGERIPTKEGFKTAKEFSLAYNDFVSKRNLLPTNEMLPNTCPSCGRDLEFDDIDLVCPNDLCPDVLISKMEHFLNVVGVEEIGRPTLISFYDYGITTPKQLFFTSEETIASMEGFGSASAKIIKTQLNKIYKEGVPMSRAMYAHDCFQGSIGEKTIQMIFDSLYGDIDKLPDTPPSVEELIKIDGVSYKTAESFLNGFLAFLNEDKFLPITYIKTPAKTVLNGYNTGKTICFSGIRDKLTEKLIEETGGKLVSGVSKKTTHLIVADVDQMTTKTIKAREYGCEILSLNDFKIKYLQDVAPQ